jgi:hypothetical protein
LNSALLIFSTWPSFSDHMSLSSGKIITPIVSMAIASSLTPNVSRLEFFAG